MQPNRKMARMAGLLYLIVIVCAGFAQGYVRAGLVVPNDMTATAENILGAQFLFRAGLVADLVAFLCDAVIAILFYALLKPVNNTLAMLAAALRLLAHPAIGSLNLLNHHLALAVLSDPGFTSIMATEQSQAWSAIFLQAHDYGYLIAGAFFGLHCLVLGYLLYRSDLFPGVLGMLMMLAAGGYVIESFGSFLVPDYRNTYALIVAVTAVVGEVSLCLWLLIRAVPSRPTVTA
ncbi:MAG: DUF4386 domain-containing protein [Leptospiraceae bacterium]|nr:DUF4386 domain-containing protein [Leptospiraceae bacterium]